jgi:hypothetical protein
MRLIFSFFLLMFTTLSAQEDMWQKIDKNAELNRSVFIHCQNFVRGWLAHSDPKTGLIPRNINNQNDFWNARDAAADNYPFMVLTSFFVDKEMYNGRMLDMLNTERKLTSRVGDLPDDFLFETQAFRKKEIDMKNIIFGASEYAKDGLMPLTEWLGPTPWRDRMVGLVDGVIENAHIQTPVGVLPAVDHEVGGEMMQILSRMYWMTGDEKYKDFALRYADYFLLHALPTENDRLSLDDHGCEVIGGLSEAYLIASLKDKARYIKYRAPMHKMLDRILEIGRNANGLFYMAVNPLTGEVLRDELTDNWGYDYNAYLTVAAVDNHQSYIDAVKFALEHVKNETGYPWEGDIADGYADAIESGLNLLNRIPIESAFEWVEHETWHMLAKQGDDGIIAGWHGDGNYARTAIMVALWKSQGCWIEPWRADVAIGAEEKDGELYLSISSKWPWSGKVIFDRPRHKEYFNMPLDYARLNQFPEWYTVEKEKSYDISIQQKNEAHEYSKKGHRVLDGIEVALTGTVVNKGEDGKIKIRIRIAGR